MNLKRALALGTVLVALGLALPISGVAVQAGATDQELLSGYCVGSNVATGEFLAAQVQTGCPFPAGAARTKCEASLQGVRDELGATTRKIDRLQRYLQIRALGNDGARPVAFPQVMIAKLTGMQDGRKCMHGMARDRGFSCKDVCRFFPPENRKDGCESWCAEANTSACDQLSKCEDLSWLPF